MNTSNIKNDVCVQCVQIFGEERGGVLLTDNRSENGKVKRRTHVKGLTSLK